MLKVEYSGLSKRHSRLDSESFKVWPSSKKILNQVQDDGMYAWRFYTKMAMQLISHRHFQVI